MDNVLEMVLLGASLLLLCVVLVSSVDLTKVGSGIVKVFSNSFNERTVAIEESQYLKYCDSDNSGSDVVSAVRKYRDSIEVKVTIFTDASSTTELSTANADQLGDSFQNIPTDQSRYINPAAKFTGSVVRTANDIIVGLVFTQKAYIPVVSAGVEPQTDQPAVTGAAGAGVKHGITNNTSYTDDSSDSSTDDSEDLDVVFSDETSKSAQDKEESTAQSRGLESISLTIATYGSQLDDLVNRLDAIDVNSDVSIVKGIESQLETLSYNLQYAQSECMQYSLSDEQKARYKRKFKKLSESINSAIATAKKLVKTIQSTQDSATTWFIGYPVKTDVKAELVGNTLQFSGSGDTVTGHDLPKWLGKSKSIKKVVFKKGVEPLNIDYWFTGCSNLKSIEGFPKSIQSANGTFSNCRNLTGSLQFGTALKSLNGIFNGTVKSIEVIATGNSGNVLMEYLKINKLHNIKVRR